MLSTIVSKKEPRFIRTFRHQYSYVLSSNLPTAEGTESPLLVDLDGSVLLRRLFWSCAPTKCWPAFLALLSTPFEVLSPCGFAIDEARRSTTKREREVQSKSALARRTSFAAQGARSSSPRTQHAFEQPTELLRPFSGVGAEGADDRLDALA